MKKILTKMGWLKSSGRINWDEIAFDFIVIGIIIAVYIAYK